MRLLRSIGFVAVLVSATSVAGAAENEISIRSLSGVIPKVKPAPGDGRNEPLCKDEWRTAETAEDKAVVAAGWMPFFAAQQMGATRVFVAASSMDGSCRPQGMAAFIFRNGKPVGMVSPRDQSAIPTLQMNAENTLIVSTNYRKSEDAHCCPTGKAIAAIKISDHGIMEDEINQGRAE